MLYLRGPWEQSRKESHPCWRMGRKEGDCKVTPKLQLEKLSGRWPGRDRKGKRVAQWPIEWHEQVWGGGRPQGWERFCGKETRGRRGSQSAETFQPCWDPWPLNCRHQGAMGHYRLRGSLYSVHKNSGWEGLQLSVGGGASWEGKAFVWQFSSKQFYSIPFHPVETWS